jgi:redox-sensitive bicupin YhaK (pirin superfamily)
VVAGTTSEGTTGAVKNDWVKPTYLDVTVPAGLEFEQAVGADDNTFLYVIEGELRVGGLQKPLAHHTLGILGRGDRVQVSSPSGARFLLVSAQPLNEPVARGGPFVMNTRDEIIQAFEDYRHNRF